MEYFTLNNGVKMPMVGYGTYRVTGSIDGSDIIASALNTGYRLLDTAQAYGNEEEVAKGIKKSGVSRQDIFLTTKVWFKDFESGDCEKSVYESLKKLDTDYLDMVLLHWPYGNYYAAYRDLEKLYKKGVIRAIGVSNFESARVMDIARFNEITPAINQIEMHLYCQRNELRGYMDKFGIKSQAYAPLGKGRVNEIFTLEEVIGIAKKHGKTTAQILLRFLTQLGTAVIPKSAQAHRIKENFEILDFTLDEDDMAVLKSLDKNNPVEGLADKPEKFEAMVDRVLFQG